MNNILIVGAGQLGSRHLQSLCKNEVGYNIDIIDLSDDSLLVAKSRASEIETHKNHELNFFNNYDSLKDQYDFAVIASSANVRLKILETLFAKSKISNMLLEKVLFQSSEQLVTAKGLLTKHNVNAWVNCPRRMFDFYQSLKTKLSDVKINSFSMSGGEWGLACNSVHILDIFEFLTGSKINTLETNSLDDKIFESKRGGFVEFYGKITGENLNNQKYSIECVQKLKELTITLETDNGTYLINESKRKLIHMDSEEDYSISYQSDLTHKTWDDIQSGNCLLTSFDDAFLCNEIYLNRMLSFYNNLTNEENKILPIT
jgi:predicted dehydrogenase